MTMTKNPIMSVKPTTGDDTLNPLYNTDVVKRVANEKNTKLSGVTIEAEKHPSALLR